MRKFLLVLFALIASTGIAMAGGHMKNLVETAAGNDAFKTLVAAVEAAGLVEAAPAQEPSVAMPWQAWSSGRALRVTMSLNRFVYSGV